uniref:Uncharacterized protein n=2 Tax=Aegilops tauschii TaxID=37682 RepID=R7W579_AEGTA
MVLPRMEACAVFPDDILVEILSRLPAKSAYRFKCVSNPWRYLISDRNHCKRLPQTLAGFFYVSESWDNNRLCPIFEQHFCNLSGCQPPLVNPMLPFLPNHADMSVLDCCKGLLLLLCHHTMITSSAIPLLRNGTVYFNGLLYFLTYEYVLVTMDLEAKELKEIELPDAGGSTFFLLGQSQGCLWYVAKDEDENKISFWTLEDGAWSFNHSFPGSDCRDPVAFHPDCNTFFFTIGLENRLMSYDIDRGKARCLFVLGSGHFDWFRPYVPCFSDTLADED